MGLISAVDEHQAQEDQAGTDNGRGAKALREQEAGEQSCEY